MNNGHAYVVDTMTVNGEAKPFETGGASIENWAGFEKEGIAEAGGNHGSVRKTVVPVVKVKHVFDRRMTLTDIKSVCNAQIVLRQSAGECKDAQSRRIRATGCDFSKSGKVGDDGFTEVEYLVTGVVQEL